jgi:hypothetical protein
MGEKTPEEGIIEQKDKTPEERDKYGIILRYQENGFRNYTDEELTIYLLEQNKERTERMQNLMKEKAENSERLKTEIRARGEKMMQIDQTRRYWNMLKVHRKDMKSGT